PIVAPALETAPSVQMAVNSAVIALNETGAPAIIGTGEEGGLELYGLDGARTASVPAGAAVGIDVRYDVPFAGRAATVAAALDAQTNSLRFYELANGALTERSARAVPVNFGGESLCLYRSPRDGGLYAFALGGAGEITQYMIFDAGNERLDARLVRQLRVASEAAYCAADDRSGALYVAEQGVGLWRFDADPEAEVVPALIDAARLGRIDGEIGGVALYDGGEGARYLIASNATASNFHVYDRSRDDAFVGSFTVSNATAPIEEGAGLFALSMPMGERLPAGALVIANEGAGNYALVSWANVAQALNLAAGTAQDPRTPIPSDIAVVHATVETRPVETDGDAADDPAVWVDPTNPARSLIIGTQKQSGLYVYDMSGAVVQFLPDGRMNNVDLRYDFPLGGARVALVAASNRTSDSIALYRVDPQARRLVNVADGVQETGFVDPYGLCMYRSAQSGRFYVFVNDSEGAMRQWELSDAGNGRVRTNLVRSFAFGGQSEGCVADDETGVLYVAEEDVGLWRMGAEPEAGDARTSIATVEANSALADDLEGVGIYDLGGGRGYLVVSSQGNNSYAVFDRQGENRYIGSFAVVADAARGIDGISETDGLEIISVPMGPGFPHGAMIAQDGRNISPPEFQNFKLVPWERIAGALNLEVR
ncbi:MAG: phytase, partial [Hyphomonadaceae bacterium]